MPLFCARRLLGHAPGRGHSFPTTTRFPTLPKPGANGTTAAPSPVAQPTVFPSRDKYVPHIPARRRLRPCRPPKPAIVIVLVGSDNVFTVLGAETAKQRSLLTGAIRRAKAIRVIGTSQTSARIMTGRQ